MTARARIRSKAWYCRELAACYGERLPKERWTRLRLAAWGLALSIAWRLAP